MSTALERLPITVRDLVTHALPEPWRWLANSLLAIVTVFVAYAYVWKRGGLEWD